jgi:hypothetical protein
MVFAQTLAMIIHIKIISHIGVFGMSAEKTLSTSKVNVRSAQNISMSTLKGKGYRYKTIISSTAYLILAVIPRLLEGLELVKSVIYFLTQI